MKTNSSFLAALALIGAAACAAGSDETSSQGGGGDAPGGQGGAAVGGMGGTGAATVSSSSSASSSSSSASSSSSSTGTGGGPDTCGNGVIDSPDEQCDGADFGGKTCATYGLGQGPLICNPYCGIVAKQCESCIDFKDNDLDGMIDCDDSDCTADSSCIDSCTPPKNTGIPSYPSGNTTGRPNVHSASCNGGGLSGPEVIYQVTAAVDGNLAVTLSSFSGADFSISIRSACADDASEIACSNKETGGSFNSEVVGTTVTAGTTYFIMVDGVSPTQKGDFYLSIDIPPPESSFNCTGLFDEDADGYVDCDDATACKGSLDCTPGNKVAGQPCFNHTECASSDGDPVCLDDAHGYPGGYCSQFCDPAAPDCLGDSVCAQIGLSVHGVCLDGCTTDGDCRPGYACVDKGLSTLVCALGPEAFCTDNQDNDKDLFVDCEDPSNCQSTPDCVPGPNPVGQTCTKHNDCAANANDPVCFDAFWYGWPQGYCSEFCNLAADDCPAGSVCSDYNSWNFPSGTGTCFHTCVGPADCRPGYSCINFGQPQNICVW